MKKVSKIGGIRTSLHAEGMIELEGETDGDEGREIAGA